MIKYPISIFIDTNIFESAKFDFSDTSVLNKLLEFIDEEKVKLYLSDIVIQEVKNHIARNTKEFCQKRQQLHGDIFKKISKETLQETKFASNISIIDKKELEGEMIKLFDDFIIKSKSIVLDNEGVDCNKIITDYFSFRPPFENNDKKRHEFPDAIMAAKLLLSFGEHQLYIVGADKGFKNTLKQNSNFFFFESLKEIYNMINKESEILYNAIKNYISHDCAFKDRIHEEIYNYIMDNNVSVDGSDCDRKGMICGYIYDETFVTNVEHISFEFSSIDKIMNDIVYLTLSASSLITAECSYFDEENSVWDSVDKEYFLEVNGKIREAHFSKFDIEVSLEIHENTFNFQQAAMEIVLDENSRIERVELPSDYEQLSPNSHEQILDEVIKKIERESIERYNNDY